MKERESDTFANQPTWQSRIAADVEHIHAVALPYRTPSGAISLHLGYPDPQAFPARDIAEATQAVLDQDPAKALQYCEEQGDSVLRAVLAQAYHHLPRTITDKNILITQGTTDALEILSQLLLSKDDVVLMEAPTYLWAIRSFQSRQAKMIGIPTDGEGIRLDLLRDRLDKLISKNIFPKFLYVMPDFQNPSGHTMTLERRREVLSIAGEYGILIIEDSPYIELRYEAERLPMLFEMDNRDLVVLAQTFSKSMGPGIRLGWIAGPEDFIKKLVKMKHTGTCTLMSRVAALYIQSTAYAKNLERVRGIYKAKCDATAYSLEQHCPDGVKWNQPKGGFYFWLSLPPRINVQEIYERAIAQGLFFLNGRDFFCDECRWNSIRLSFSYESEENIVRGISLLGRLLSG